MYLFPLQIKQQVEFNVGSLDCKRFFEEVFHRKHESSLSSQSRDECLSTQQGDLHRSEVKPCVDQYSDDSDSEIFRVKRRSSLKVEKRVVNDVPSKNSEHQV